MRAFKQQLVALGCGVLMLGLSSVAAQVEVPAVAEQRSSATRLALGLSLVTEDERALASDEEIRFDSLYVRLIARWSEIERADGVHDWSSLDGDLDRLHRDGARIVLALGGSPPDHVGSDGFPSPLDGDSVAAWLRFVRSAVGRFAGRIESVEIWDDLNRGATGDDDRISADDYAFVLKQSALAARAEARGLGHDVRVSQVPVAATDLSWQRRLWDLDVAAYIDILPLAVAAGAADEEVVEVLTTMVSENLVHPPAAEVWAQLTAGPGAEAWSAAEDAVRALSNGVPVALVRPGGSGGQSREIAGWVAGVQQLLADDFAPAPMGRVTFEDAEAKPREDGRVVGSFLADENFTTLVFYRLPGPAEDLPSQRMLVETTFVRNARLVDPLTGEVLRVGATPLSDGARGRAIRVAAGAYPKVIVFERPTGSAGFALPPVEVETTRERELTAEEIIAFYQQVQKIEDDHLDRWMAQGRVDYHFRFAQGGSTIDVSIDTQYFWERGGELEWEELDYYINGNKVPWKRFPKIPLIQPEKVMTLPLDLTLDKAYAYKLLGREKVGGREAYLLEFRPHDPTAPDALYRGRVWIDTTEFYRVKASLVQTQLEAPVLSNEEIDRFSFESDEEGNEFWLLGKIEGQQVWNTAGRNFVVRREVTFIEYDLNPPADRFEERRQLAYDSKHNMMRDTADGFRYLDPGPDGTRVLKKPAKSQWFAALGAFSSGATGGVQPFAGANYFNFDIAGKNLQLNALIAGVVNVVTLSKPDLAGGKVSVTGDLFASALYFADKVYFEDDELIEERVDQRTQSFDVRFGFQVAEFVRLDLVGGVRYRQYDHNEDGQEAIDSYNAAVAPEQFLRFVLPPDHLQGSGEVRLEFNRRGYSLIARTRGSVRSEWDEWGLFDEVGGEFVVYDPLTGRYDFPNPNTPTDRFARWNVLAFKEWYFEKFQKVRAEVNLMGGLDLDRFSKYQFSLFGNDGLSGFAGTGVRFDEGVIGRFGYSFNLFEVLKLDILGESAWIRDEIAFDGTRNFSGVGLTANFVGPWKTVYTVNYGYAVASDIPDLQGSQEFFVLILKLF
jgi:hypothetical protein